jgi:hypothetical protein
MRQLGIGALLVIGTTVVGVGAAGQVVTDVRKACQVTVPANWTSKLGSAYAPGEKVSATVHGLRANQTFDTGKAMSQQVMKPIKVLRDDGTRFIYTMDPGAAAPGKHGWEVVANTSPVCTLAITFDGAGDEALMKEMAESLGPAAK